ncbi:hypothetical protein [uncultured Methanobrevibacter sp.]|uniref:hypothetical protein n=1 Tax=uncultured Methanobrevibacter sp. TaxID=253161 RepID=UPI0031838C3E
MGYQNGTSEQYVGKAVREYASREDVVVATNFCQGLKRTLKIMCQVNSTFIIWLIKASQT